MYGLVGSTLKHSFSKEIHNFLGNKDYNLYEVNSIEEFIKNQEFDGINITIPFKTDIIPYLDEIDDISRETYSVNTVVKKHGKLYGYNTDYYGLKSLLGYNKIKIKNQNILILGNGSVSKTVLKLMNDLQAKSVIRLVRNIKSKSDHHFSEYINFSNYDVIINTTPVGMYPNNDDDLLIDLSVFTKLKVVIDLIYNPLRTKLLVEAKKLNIKVVNGLYMLIMQAVNAHELFFNKKIPLNIVNKLYRKIYKKHLNIVFVGLPLSGKTKFSNILSETIHKKPLDTDQIIEKETKTSIPDIFEKYGEKHFRNIEHDVVKKIYKLQNLVISTGGGLIENQKNLDLLSQNGIIIFLNKNPETISNKTIYGRPLLKDPTNILKLAKKRVPLYNKYADIIININKDTDTHLNEMKEAINEYINR